MALKLDYNVKLEYELRNNTGVLTDVKQRKTEIKTVKDCYIKITDIIPAVAGGTPAYAPSFEGEEIGSVVRYDVYNADKTVLITRNEIQGFRPSVAEDAPNIVKQAYEYLKTTQTFINALDVFEEGQS